jgi:hypothetical protein
MPDCGGRRHAKRRGQRPEEERVDRQRVDLCRDEKGERRAGFAEPDALRTA